MGEKRGPVSRVGYTPDSFGHPAQFPRIFAGFGIDSFVYWRGNGNELDRLPSEYLWEAPDGSRVLAWKELLKNQAHDSICGCSRDEVHEQMRARSIQLEDSRN